MCFLYENFVTSFTLFLAVYISLEKFWFIPIAVCTLPLRVTLCQRRCEQRYFCEHTLHQARKLCLKMAKVNLGSFKIGHSIYVTQK